MEIEKKLRKKIGEKRGSSLPLACALVLAFIIFMSVMSQYLRLMIIAGGVRNALEASIVTVATGNYSKVYAGLREGYAGGYEKEDAGEWKAVIDKGDVYDELDRLLGLSVSGGQHLKMLDSGGHEFKLYGLTVEVDNTSFALESPEDFTAEAVISLEVPVSFGDSSLPPMKLDLRVESVYSPKF